MKNTPFHLQKYQPGLDGELQDGPLCLHSKSAMLSADSGMHYTHSGFQLFLCADLSALNVLHFLVSWENYVQFWGLCSASLSLGISPSPLTIGNGFDILL